MAWYHVLIGVVVSLAVVVFAVAVYFRAPFLEQLKRAIQSAFSLGPHEVVKVANTAKPSTKTTNTSLAKRNKHHERLERRFDQHASNINSMYSNIDDSSDDNDDNVGNVDFTPAATKLIRQLEDELASKHTDKYFRQDVMRLQQSVSDLASVVSSLSSLTLESQLTHSEKQHEHVSHNVPTFVSAPRTYWISVSNADYDKATNILTVPVNMTQCTSFELVEMSMPRTMYTINQYCDTLTIVLVNANGSIRTSATCTLTRQDYDSYSALAVEVSNKANAALTGLRDGGGDLLLSVTASSATHKFTFSMSNSQRFFFQFTQATLGYMLGFGTQSIYPRVKSITDDAATTYLVKDVDADELANNKPNTTTFGPASALTSSSVNLVVDGITSPWVVYSHAAATISFSSTSRADLFGGRYLVIDCPALRTLYANTSTVALVNLANEMNYVERSSDMTRLFAAPATLHVLSMTLKIRQPNGVDVPCDTQDLAFVLRFAVVANHMVLNRTDPPRHRVFS